MKKDLTDQQIRAIASFRSSKDYKIILDLFYKRLEDHKNLLVRAKGDVFLLIQGRAQEQQEIIEALTLNESQQR